LTGYCSSSLPRLFLLPSHSFPPPFLHILFPLPFTPSLFSPVSSSSLPTLSTLPPFPSHLHSSPPSLPPPFPLSSPFPSHLHFSPPSLLLLLPTPLTPYSSNSLLLPTPNSLPTPSPPSLLPFPLSPLPTSLPLYLLFPLFPCHTSLPSPPSLPSLLTFPLSLLPSHLPFSHPTVLFILAPPLHLVLFISNIFSSAASSSHQHVPSPGHLISNVLYNSNPPNMRETPWMIITDTSSLNEI
jgi:hypothetical protein